jgi:PTS system mannose-specific IIB component
VAKTIFRIDDRLIHGQVIEGWVHALNLTRITIASDRIKEDESYKKILEISVPSEIKVDVLGIRELAQKNNRGYLDEEDTIVLFESPGDVLELLDYGTKIGTLNVGCLHYDGFNRKLKRNIAATEKDIDDFKDINSMGTKLECRSVPADKKIDLMEIINRIK